MTTRNSARNTRGLGTPVPSSKPQPTELHECKTYKLDPAEIDRMLAEKYPPKKLRLPAREAVFLLPTQV